VTLPALLKLRADRYKLGFASKGQGAKHWQKLIQVGLEHVFHAVTVSEETGSEALTSETLHRTLEKSIFVACHLSNEIAAANAASMISVRIRTWADRTSSPRNADETATYEVRGLEHIADHASSVSNPLIRSFLLQTLGISVSGATREDIKVNVDAGAENRTN